MATRQEFSRANDTLFSAVAAVADAFYVVDASGRALFINPAALRILGYAHEEEVLGKPTHEMFHRLHPDGSPFPREDCPLLQPMSTGETIQIDHDCFVRKDGSFIAIEYSSAPITFDDGWGAVVAFRDISERLRLGEVEASRLRIAHAAEDARRKIQRDLHDGAQQHFVAVAMQLEHARGLLKTSPDKAANILELAKKNLCEAIEDLRRLAHGIHPPLLAECGLAPALRSLARRSAIPVEVKADALERLPSEIENTAYFIAAETVTNASKHAKADHVEIMLAQGSDMLQMTVTDDGVGGATIGAGLQGLCDRADTIGGRLTLTSPTGGPTVVSAELPLHPEGPARALRLHPCG